MQSPLKKVSRLILTMLLAGPVLLSQSAAAIAQTRIEAGDRLELTVFNHPDLSTDMVVTSSGDVRVPIAGDVSVLGLSQEAATQRVQRALTPFFFLPSVDIRVLTQGQSIFFTGSLIGAAAYQPGETLASAIGTFRQMAGTMQVGAPTGTAGFGSIDLRSVRIKRNQEIMPPVDIEALSRAGDSGPHLEPGDVVLLKDKPIRVDIRGDLGTPAIVYLNSGETLAQAVAQTGSFPAATSLTSIGLHRDGVDSVVSSAGEAFKGAAHDGDVVTLQPAPRVTVLGMVEKAGDTTLQTRPTLLNALYEAGGPNRYADLGHIQISHAGATRVVNVAKLTHGDLSQNSEVSDGDVIFVPEGHKIDLGSFATAIGALTSLKFLSGI